MKCFVIMPFDARFDDVYETIRRTVDDAESLRCVRIDEITRPGSILDDLVAELESASVCVADLTGNRPNVLWEVGYAMALRRPMILITEDLGGIPFDLAPNRTIEYERADLSATLAPRLRAALASVDGPSARDPRAGVWASMRSSLEGGYSDAALGEVLDRASVATGQRRPRVRLWGNSRAVGTEDRRRFETIGGDIGRQCAARGLPMIGASDDDRTLEVSALSGACDHLRSHPPETGYEFVVHFADRGNATRPNFDAVTDPWPAGLRIVHVEYPFRDGKRLGRVATVVGSGRDGEHDARYGSLLQSDIVLLLGAGDSAHNMLELILSMENLRLRAAPPHVLVPLPWIPGVGRDVYGEFTGRVDWRLLGRVESATGAGW